MLTVVLTRLKTYQAGNVSMDANEIFILLRHYTLL